MRLRIIRTVLFAAVVASAPLLPRAHGQTVVIARTTEQTQTIDPAMVRQLPRIDLHITMQTEHGTEQAAFAGPLLWAVLQHAVVVPADPRTHVRATVLVTGRDGYTAVLALAEIDPAFEGKQVILADTRNGHPMPGDSLRLVVPGDRRGGRSVRDVVRIELR